ncbi:MAG: hypothetical protein JXB38_02725 [Anaerolineales bacterium]|nr:hypothetical protein [Anaerolineales bacterium]
MKTNPIRLPILFSIILLLASCGEAPLTPTSTSIPIIPSEIATITAAKDNYLPTFEAKMTLWASQTAAPTTIPTATPTLVRGNPSAVINAATITDLQLRKEFSLGSSVYSVSFSQASSLLAAAPWKGEIKLWNATTLRRIETAVIAEPASQLISQAPDQISVVKTGDVFDLTTGDLLSSFTGYVFGGKSGVSSDGRMIAVSSASKLLYENIDVWDLINKKRVITLYGDWATGDPHGWPVPYYVFFSPDDSLLVATLNDGSTIIWDVASGERVQEFESAAALVFSHDGTKLATSLPGGRIGVYDISTWKPVNTYIASTSTWSAVFTPDDELLIVGTREESNTIWDWKTGDLVHTISPNGSQLLLSPDGTLLVTYNDGSDDIYLWGVP